MQHVDSIVVTPDMRTATAGLVDRLGSFVLKADPRWKPLVHALGIGPTNADRGSVGSVLLVGSPASLLAHASTATSEFGFVVAVAQTTRWWQRTPAWRDETMLDLWSDGWTPVAIDRLVTAKHDAGVEFAIGNARPTPPVIESD